MFQPKSLPITLSTVSPRADFIPSGGNLLTNLIIHKGTCESCPAPLLLSPELNKL